jgi:hypothetical protein
VWLENELYSFVCRYLQDHYEGESLADTFILHICTVWELEQHGQNPINPIKDYEQERIASIIQEYGGKYKKICLTQPDVYNQANILEQTIMCTKCRVSDEKTSKECRKGNVS